MIQSLIQGIPTGIFLLLSASSVILGDYFAKTWSVGRDPKCIVFALAGYLFSGIFYIPTLLKSGLVLTSTIWSIAEIGGFLVIGLLLFNESLTVTQAFGVGLGVVSLVILSIR